MHFRSKTICLSFVATLGGTFLSCHQESKKPDEELKLAYASQSARTLIPRLSGFPYAPELRVTRGDEATPDLVLRATALRIVAVPKTARDDPETIKTRAAAAVITGNASVAAELLHDLLKHTGQRADLWNDLAVSLYQVAKQQDDPSQLAAALAAIDRSLALSTSFEEATFNRATILDAMSLHTSAAKTWQTYLMLDSGSKWADEATEALARDRRPTTAERWKIVVPTMERAIRDGDLPTLDSVVDGYAQQARTWGEGEYLCRWAEEWLAGRREAADASLLIAQSLGVKLAKRRGETLLRSAVGAIERTPQAGVENLARAYVLYKRARLLIRDRKPSEADALLAEAERRFATSNSPMELVARYFHAGVAFDLRDAQRALQYLSSVEAALPPGFDALRAEVLWERSRILGRRGDLYASLIAASAATRIFDRLGETENRSFAAIEVASMLFELGRPEEAWRIRKSIFEGASVSGSFGLLQRSLNNAAGAEIRDQHLEIARSLLDLALDSTVASPLTVFDAHLTRAFVGQRLGERIEPPTALDALAERITDPALKEEASDRVRFFEALIVTDEDPKRSTRLLDDAIAFRRRTHRLSRLADAQFEKARALRKSGRIDEAITELNAALSTLELQRDNVPAEDFRDSFFASADEMCDALVSLHQSRRESDLAFAAVDRCRGRAVGDLVTGATLQPGAIDELQRHLGKTTAVVVYAPLREYLLTWVVTAVRRESFVVPITRDALQRWAGDLRLAMQREDADGAHVAEQRLSGALIAPIEARFPIPEHLVVVPDTLLAGVPIAALKGRDGRWLISKTQVVIAPSASAVRRSERPYMRPGAPLVIGNPDFVVDPVHSLPRLPAAGVEARNIATLYGNAVLLLEGEATAARFLEMAPVSDLIHLGAHVLLSAHDARDSALLLAPSSGDTGSVTLRRIASMHLRPESVVVLAGCKSAAFGGGRGSVRSLSYAFLAAGSRAVIANLWDADDETSRVFSTAIHRRLRDGVTPPAALRETQLAMSESADPRISDPRSWAAFQLYAVN